MCTTWDSWEYRPSAEDALDEGATFRDTDYRQRVSGYYGTFYRPML